MHPLHHWAIRVCTASAAHLILGNIWKSRSIYTVTYNSLKEYEHHWHIVSLGRLILLVVKLHLVFPPQLVNLDFPKDIFVLQDDLFNM